MANRLAFDIGLHVSRSEVEVTELERLCRRRAMAACVMFDRKWALLLGRPTSIKIQDVAVDVLPMASGKPLSNHNMGPSAASHAAVYQQLFELMELAGKVADFQNSMYRVAPGLSAKGAEDRAYLHFLALERLFQNWYRRLPENLAWKPANIKSGHMSFFMLHQQFHVCLILLHRPWAKYGPMSYDGAVTARYPSPDSPGHDKKLHSWISPLLQHDNRASLSRSMCTQHAVRVARIFWHHRQRFDGRRIGLSGVQHAGTAALALLAALAHKSAELDHYSNLRYLQVLSTAIYDMSHSYQPAARMYHLLKTMLVDIRSEMVKSGGLDVSAVTSRFRHGNSTSFGGSHWAPTGTHGGHRPAARLENTSGEYRSAKRRRLSSHSNTDLPCLDPVSISNGHQGCSSPPGSSQSLENSNTATESQVSFDIVGVSNESTFDLDLLHASFIDFMNNGAPSQDWASTASAPDPAENLNLNFTASENTPSHIGVKETTNNAPLAAPAVDDDTAVDMAIEEWLAEPSERAILTPPASAPQQRDNAAKPQAELAPPTELEAFTELILPSCIDGVSNNDDTDPLALGLDLDLPDAGDDCSDGGGGTGMEWIVGAPPPVAGPPVGEVEPRPPVAPVTLDDLVQSVEEAVGSARARAQAKAQAKARVAAAAATAAERGRAEESSPVARNRELDYLAL